MTVLAIAAGYDRPGVNARTGRPWRDATGAFIPEAREFVRIHGGALELLDVRQNQAARIADTMRILQRYSGTGYDCVAFFMHGFRDGLQCGFTLRNRTTLARALGGVLTGPRAVALYACDAARDADDDRRDDDDSGPGGVGGFASVLATDLGTGHVDAHSTAAHTTKNPYLRRFGADGVGHWIADPAGPLWARWRKKLQVDRRFRLSFPLMTAEEIRGAL
jgi:hypothetical protein